MSLSLDIEAAFGGFRLEAAFTAAGRLTAIIGPSGAGKTSLANVIAGLAKPRRGHIRLGARTLFDDAAGIDLPAHRRRIGYVFQDARLFPHLDVAGNLRYGAVMRRARIAPARHRFILDLLGLEPLRRRRVAALSGGEKQRVAMARALLSAPDLLLMDEPLAALDEARKADILPYIERLRDEAKLPILYISHALEEVLRLADSLVALAGGKMIAAGRPAEVLAAAAVPLGLAERADFPSAIEARVAAHDPAFGLTRLDLPGGHFFVPLIAGPLGRAVRVTIRARDVMLALAPPAGVSALNRVAATVRRIEPLQDGIAALIELESGGGRFMARVTRKSVAALALAPGAAIHALVKSVAIERDHLAPTAGEAINGR